LERVLFEFYIKEAFSALSMLIHECFGDTVEYKALRALSERPMTLRGLAKALGEKECSVKAFNGYAGRLRRVVERLASKGVLEVKRAGRAQLYFVAEGARGALLRELFKVPHTEADFDQSPGLPCRQSPWPSIGDDFGKAAK